MERQPASPSAEPLAEPLAEPPTEPLAEPPAEKLAFAIGATRSIIGFGDLPFETI